MENNYTLEEYNNEPVYFCKSCLSLKIRDLEGVDYCDFCGHTEVSTTDIDHWRDLYNQKYNKEY